METDEWIEDMLAIARDATPCMALYVDEESKSVELLLDSTSNYTAEHIPGEDGDICLYRDSDTGRIVGALFPLKQSRLVVNGLDIPRNEATAVIQQSLEST